jgi:hypothetical protein
MKQWTPKLNAVNTITSNKKQRIFYICLRGMPFCLRDNPHSSRKRFSQPSKVAYISAIHNVTSNNARPTTNSSRIGLPAPSWSRGNPPFPDRRQPREVNALSKQDAYIKWKMACSFSRYLTPRGIGCGKGFELPSRLSYVALPLQSR